MVHRATQSSPPPTLIRALGVRSVAANILNSVVGSGIFALPAVVAGVLGPAAAAAYVVCGGAIGLVGLCFAELGSRVETSGGAYAYVEAAFGRYIGFLAGVLFWTGSLVGGNAAVATIFVNALGLLIPGTQGSTAHVIILLGLYGGLAFVNIRGVRGGARLMELLTVAKLAPLVVLGLAGAFLVHPAQLAWSGVPTLAALGRASLLLMFAFLGMETALTSSGEIRNPARTVPRAIVSGLVMVMLLYSGLQLVSQGVLGPALLRTGDAPLAALAEQVFGRAGRSAIAVAALISAFGYISGDVLASPRLLFAFAREGFLPARLAAIHERYHTPHAAIVGHVLTCMLVALSGTFRSLALLTTVATLLIYLACCLAVLELRRRDVRTEAQPFRAVGGPVIPLAACAVVVWLLSGATAREAIAATVTLMLATGLYFVRSWTAHLPPDVAATELH